MSRRYRNAAEILPDELLRELRKYAPGELLYVPADVTRTGWGNHSGARQYYRERNAEIRRRYFDEKVSVFTLAEIYNLSEDTIRKIIYSDF
jgi:hypothetical protein